MSRFHRYVPAALAGVVLFASTVVASYWHLWSWMHPISVLMHDYLPLIRRLPDFLDHYYAHQTFPSVVAVLLVVAISLFTRRTGFGFAATMLILGLPTALALAFQFFVIQQLDKYVVLFLSEGYFLLPSFDARFDIPLLLQLAKLLSIYIATAAVISLLIHYITPVPKRPN